VRLEDVTAEIRPRVPWESIDLGCALARRHIGSIWKAWAVTVVPLWVILAVLLRHHPVWFIVVSWWLKPIYDRVPLFILSRALFGVVPKVLDVLKAWPGMLVRRLWFALVWGRFSPARCLSLPVSELEGLRKKAYRDRVDLLARNGGEGATMATLAGLILETVAALGLVIFMFMMVPSEIVAKWFSGIEEFFDMHDLDEIPHAFFWALAVVRLISFTLMEPFYIGAGFALYVNSRTLTEGWDIELAFKRMGARIGALKKSSAMLLLIAVFIFSPTFSPPLRAEDSLVKDQVGEVLKDDDFTIHYRFEEVPVGRTSSNLPHLNIPEMGFIGVIFKLIFYLAIVALVAGLVYVIYKNRHIFMGDGLKSLKERETKTCEVMGMDVRPESLPNDVVAAAREAWHAGDYQLALSLLYRGSLVWLVHRENLPIEESDTEGDCLRRVKDLDHERITPYFIRLTKVWMRAAYGKLEPDSSEMSDLCEAWPFKERSRK